MTRAFSGRVLILLEHARLGGGTLVAADLLDAWRDVGVHAATLVLGLADDAMVARLGRAPLDVLELEGHRARIRAVRDRTASLGPHDVVFAVGDYCGLVAAAAIRAPGRRGPGIVVGEHQPRPLRSAVRAARGPVLAAVVGLAESLLRRRVAASVLTADPGEDADAGRRRGQGRPRQVIPNPSRIVPADPAAIAARVARIRSGGRVRLIAIGALNPQKDHPTLLGALDRLDARFHLTAVGKGDATALRARSDVPDPGDRATFTGLREDVADLLDDHDLYVLSSRWETAYPIVVIEAIARGLPVVATECSPLMRSFAASFPTVHLAPVADPAALAEAIAAVAAAPPTADRLTAAAAEIMARHDPGRSAAAHLALFATVTGA